MIIHRPSVKRVVQKRDPLAFLKNPARFALIHMRTKLRMTDQNQKTASHLSRLFKRRRDRETITRDLYSTLKSMIPISGLALFIPRNGTGDLIIVTSEKVPKTEEKRILSWIKTHEGRLTDPSGQALSFLSLKQKVGKHLVIGSVETFRLVSAEAYEGSLFLLRPCKTELTSEEKMILDFATEELALYLSGDKSRKELADSRKNLGVMLGALTEGVVILNQHHEVLAINKSAQNILAPEKVKLHEILWHRFKNEPLREGISKRILDNTTGLSKIEFFSGTQKRTLSLSLAPIHDSFGKIDGSLLFLTDISLEREVDRLKSELISITSHEFRTPLTSIKEAINLALEQQYGPLSERQEHYLKIASRNVLRLIGLVDNLLNLSQIESGKLSLKQSEVSLQNILKIATEPFQPLAQSGKVSIVSSASDTLPHVRCDPERILQVIVNLIDNALKFTPPQGTIRLSAKTNSDWMTVFVSDTGPGIDPKNFPLLFQRFGQIDRSLTRERQGSGLGLAICKNLVELHGGKIGVKSQPGQGATFFFTLPLQSR